MTAGEIDERFQHTWPTTSRHLRVLEAAGLLVHEKQGRARIYRVDTAKLGVVREWLGWFESNGPDEATAKPTREHTAKKRARRPKRSRLSKSRA